MAGARPCACTATKRCHTHSPAAQQDIAKEAAQAIVILAILERCHLTRPVTWLEARARLAFFVGLHLLLALLLLTPLPLTTLLLTPLTLAQEHVDYLSVQALLFSSQLSRYQQARPPHLVLPVCVRVADGQARNPLRLRRRRFSMPFGAGSRAEEALHAWRAACAGRRCSKLRVRAAAAAAAPAARACPQVAPHGHGQRVRESAANVALRFRRAAHI